MIQQGSKTRGSTIARLIAELYDRGQTIFTPDDVETITGLSRKSVYVLVNRAHRRGVLHRLKSGLYTVVPDFLGHAQEYQGDPNLIAARLAEPSPYYIGFGSAMEIHRMVVQPHFATWLAVSRRMRSQKIAGYDIHIVYTPGDTIFGTAWHTATIQGRFRVSDLERTILDGMRYPNYVGGITEIARGLWMRRSGVVIPRLIDYALRLNIGAAIRRLGYILELYQLASTIQLDRLRGALTASYAPLDLVPAEAPSSHPGWKLQLTVPEEELLAVRFG